MNEFLAIIEGILLKASGRSEYRKRNPIDFSDVLLRIDRASPETTFGYVNLVCAYGYARFQEDYRREVCRKVAAQLLEGVSDDDIHSYLIKAYNVRIAQASCGLSLRENFPPTAIQQLKSLGRSSRYKVDLLREVSPILGSNTPTIALKTFLGEKNEQESTLTHERVRAATPEQSAARIMSLLESSRFDDAYHLLDSIISSDKSSLEITIPMVAISVLSTRDVTADLCALTMFASAIVARRDLTIACFSKMRMIIGSGNVPSLSTLTHALRALQRLDLREQISDIIQLVQGATAKLNMIGALILDSSLAFLHNTTGSELYETICPSLHRRPYSWDLARAVAYGATFGGPRFALAQLRLLTDSISAVDDCLSSSTHFELCVISVSESIVLATVDSSRSLTDKESQTLSSWDYSLGPECIRAPAMSPLSDLSDIT